MIIPPLRFGSIVMDYDADQMIVHPSPNSGSQTLVKAHDEYMISETSAEVSTIEDEIQGDTLKAQNADMRRKLLTSLQTAFVNKEIALPKTIVPGEISYHNFMRWLASLQGRVLSYRLSFAPSNHRLVMGTLPN